MAQDIKVLIQAVLDSKQFKKAVGDMENKAKKSSSGIRGTLSKLKAGYIAVAAIISGAVVKSLSVLVKYASDAREAQNAVNVTFKEGAQIIQDYAKTSAKSIGLSSTSFKELATVIGAQLKNSGLSVNDVANETINLTERAADLASVFNTEVSDATIALGAALRGETEPARRFGITVSDNAIFAEALAIGLVKTKKEMTEQIKVQARLALIMRQSKDVVGDFSNTSKDFANSTRILRARWENFAARLGTFLLPVLTKVTSKLNEIIGPLDDVVARFEKWTKTSTGVKTLAVSFEILKGVVKGAIDLILFFPRVFVTNINVAKESLISFGKIWQMILSGNIKQAIAEFGKTMKEGIIKNVEVAAGSFINMKDIAVNAYKAWNTAQVEVGKQSEQTNNDIQNHVKETARVTQDIEKLILESVKETEIDKLQAKIDTLQQFMDMNNLAADDQKRIEDAITAYHEQQLELRKAQNLKYVMDTLNGFKTIFGSAAQVANDLTEINKRRLEATDKDDTVAWNKAKERLRSSQKAAKALAISNTVIETIVSAQRAFSSLAAIPVVGVPLGIAAAAAAGVAGGARVAKISSTPLAQFEKGGRPKPGQDAIVGEGGMELFRPDRPGTIIPNNSLMGLSFDRAGVGGMGSVSETTNNTTNSPTYNFYGIRDLAAARNELIRTEGQGAF